MCFEIFFAECQKNNTRQISSLPSVKKTLGKDALCRVSKKNTRQRDSLPSVKKYSANSLFAECQKKTLGKGVFAECPKKNTRQTTWHSAKSRSPVVI